MKTAIIIIKNAAAKLWQRFSKIKFMFKIAEYAVDMTESIYSECVDPETCWYIQCQCIMTIILFDDGVEILTCHSSN